MKVVAQGTRQRGYLGPDVKKFSILLYTYKFFLQTEHKKILTEPKSYTAILLYLFFDSVLSTCPKKMETEKWPRLPTLPYSS